MSNIDNDSLVFALPVDNGKMIKCQMGVSMIMNWMFVVYPHVDNYRRMQSHYINLASQHGVPDDDFEGILDYSNSIGMKDDMQVLIMKVITDLRETMGDEDFLDLWQLETTEDDEKYLSEQNWVGLNKDGTTHNAKMKGDVPIYEDMVSEHIED